jgi:hypothetical protein
MIITVNIAKSRFNMNAREGNFLSNPDSTGFQPKIARNQKMRMSAEVVPADASARGAEVSARRRRQSSDPRAIPQCVVMASLLQCSKAQEEDFT